MSAIIITEIHLVTVTNSNSPEERKNNTHKKFPIIRMEYESSVNKVKFSRFLNIEWYDRSVNYQFAAGYFFAKQKPMATA